MNGKSAVEKWWCIFREFLGRIMGLFKKWTGLILKYLKIVKKIFKSECKSVFFTNSSFLCSLGLLTVSPHRWIVKSNHICLLKIHWARKLNSAYLHNCTYPLHMFLLAINYYTLMALVIEVKQLYKIHVLDTGKHYLNHLSSLLMNKTLYCLRANSRDLKFSCL